ncbi:MAG: hypothetical protein ABJ387_01490 [Balneola sp.]
MAKKKSQKLRAFKIENNDLSKPNTDLQGVLSSKLNDSIANDRRMLLNQDDVKQEEDLISDFDAATGFISGVMLRITHAEDVPNIPDKFLSHKKISINELDNIETDSSIIYKDHYYFLLNNNFVITNLRGNLPIKRFQVYINHLLENERGNTFFEFTPLIIKHEATKLSDINRIIVKDNDVSVNSEADRTGNKKFSMDLNLLKDLIKDVNSLKKILENNIVSAELLIKFSKPRKMSSEDYQKIMGAYMKPISETDDISFATKKHGRIKGTEILKTKVVNIELTETNKISEPQLYQEMEKFLLELTNENNN